MMFEKLIKNNYHQFENFYQLIMSQEKLLIEFCNLFLMELLSHLKPLSLCDANNYHLLSIFFKLLFCISIFYILQD